MSRALLFFLNDNDLHSLIVYSLSSSIFLEVAPSWPQAAIISLPRLYLILTGKPRSSMIHSNSLIVLWEGALYFVPENSLNSIRLM